MTVSLDTTEDKPMTKTLIGYALATLLTITAVACSDNKDRDNPGSSEQPMNFPAAFDATVYRTEGGFPHIVADDFGSLGYGTGYAAAENHLCEIAYSILQHRGQLAEHLGPDEGRLDSDFFYRLLAAMGTYDAEIRPEMDTIFTGYAAGFNRYLSDTGIDNITDPNCLGATWVQPMTQDDVRRIHLTPIFLPNFARFIVPSAPPVVVAAADGAPATAHSEVDVFAQQRNAELERQENMALATVASTAFNPKDKGSNAVAIGKELSESGRGMLFSNPHISWNNEFTKDFGIRLYGMHQIIPGLFNVLGATTARNSLVGFGTNGDVAWTGTISTSSAFTFYRMSLVPGNPLQYTYEGEVRDIEPIVITANAIDESGNVSEQSHTFYRTHFGLMLGGQFTWTEVRGYSLRIANEGARGQQGGLLDQIRSKNVRELRAVLSKYHSLPASNTIAADSAGEVFYGDFAPALNWTDEQLIECDQTLGTIYWGDRASCEWNNDDDAPAPGMLGSSKRAQLFRDDYVTNSNDSFWLANPNEPITGIPMISGDIEDERTLRTRSGLSMIAQRQGGSDGLSGLTFSLSSFVDRMLSNQNHAGQLLRDDLVILCEANPSVDLDGNAVDISPACPILDAWDLHNNLDSRGAHLFREFMLAANGGDSGNRWLPESLNYAVPFDLADPVNTPRGLDTDDNPAALLALATAVQVLNDAGITLDARLGDVQSVTRNGTVIPMHGGEEMEGVFNKMTLARDGAGYPAITGSSGTWIMFTEFTDDGPVIKAITTYSESSNPASPHYSDLTEKWSRKELLDLPYHLEEVEAAALSTMTLSEGGNLCQNNGWRSYPAPAFTSEEECSNYFMRLHENRLTDFTEG